MIACVVVQSSPSSTANEQPYGPSPPITTSWPWAEPAGVGALEPGDRLSTRLVDAFPGDHDGTRRTAAVPRSCPARPCRRAYDDRRRILLDVPSSLTADGPGALRSGRLSVAPVGAQATQRVINMAAARNGWWRAGALAVGIAIALAPLSSAGASDSSDAALAPLLGTGADVIAGRYIVVLDDSATDARDPERQGRGDGCRRNRPLHLHPRAQGLLGGTCRPERSPRCAPPTA